MNVDIRELWIYVTTVRKANLQKVSKSIELSSSTLSRDLSNLSSRLEFDLYRKDKKSFISTEKGLLFYDLARLLIVILKRMESLSDSGGISIGLSREKYSVPLTDALQTFIEQKPDLRTEIHYGNRRDLRNALMNENQVREFCPIGREERAFLEKIYRKFSLSPRRYYKLLKIARTASDVAGKKDIDIASLNTAAGYTEYLNSYGKYGD